MSKKPRKKIETVTFVHKSVTIYFERTNAICVFYLGSFYVLIHSQQSIASILRTQQGTDYKKIKTIGKKKKAASVYLNDSFAIFTL